MKSLTSIVLAGFVTGCMADAADIADDDGQDVEESTQYDELVARHCDRDNKLPNHVPVRDATGVFTSVSAQGSIDLDNEFFQDLGSNGRRCVTCHVPTVGWTITPRQLKTVFELTDGGKFEDGLGLSAVFRTVDGSNSPNADVSTLAKRRKAYSMLLDHGVIRIGLPMPANAEFDLVAVDDPYGFASAKELSLFRRPLPTANLKFDSTVMWDGREVVPGATVASELETQASDATVLHAQGKPLAQGQRASIRAFLTGLASAQIVDDRAGRLDDDGAKGGPDAILKQEFHIGINDNQRDPVTGAEFTSVVFNIFDRWTNARGRHEYAREQIARGQKLFNTKAINITGVSGINDEAAFGTPAKLVGTCTTCHNTPTGGNHSVVAPLNIGLVDASRRTADMPLYTLRNKTTGQVVKVTDPGRAMIDGKWSHIGRFKGPMLRNLAPRAPYFHNGFAKDLDAVVDFYNDRFAIGFTKQERADLIAFLRSL
jgi:cytochrome c peroxidase